MCIFMQLVSPKSEQFYGPNLLQLSWLSESNRYQAIRISPPTQLKLAKMQGPLFTHEKGPTTAHPISQTNSH